MKRKRSRLEVSQQVYLNTTDISDLLLISMGNARRLYQAADRIDREHFKQFRSEPRKVRTTVVCKLAGVNLDQLQRQIKNG